jgi:hypothetical protein
MIFDHVNKLNFPPPAEFGSILQRTPHMKPTPERDDADRQSSLKWSEIRATSLRLEEQRKHAPSQPSTEDQAWRWFLTLFTDSSREPPESGENSARRAA